MRAYRRPQRDAHPRRARHPDGRAPSPLLAAGRRGERARRQPDQARASDGRGPRPLPRPWRPLRPDRPPLPASPRRYGARLGRGNRHPLLVSRLARGRERPLPRTALRRHDQSEAVEGGLRDNSLPGERMRGSALRLYGPAAGAGTAGVGAVHLAQRFPRDRARRRALQLVPVPGELDRPGAFRMDARQLGQPAARRRRQRCAQASQAQIRGVRSRLHLQARARGAERTGPLLDGRARRAVAQRFLSRQSFRMARAGRRREHAQRGVVFRARAQGPRALRAGTRADLGEPGPRRRLAAGLRATSSTRTSSPGSARDASPTAPRRICVPATSA